MPTAPADGTVFSVYPASAQRIFVPNLTYDEQRTETAKKEALIIMPGPMVLYKVARRSLIGGNRR